MRMLLFRYTYLEGTYKYVPTYPMLLSLLE